ncbi:helix-turn-helix domain-containing protein [Pantoea sp.]|uniref:helix-turn-helix domain-containing protein n=1 Tax=Pantoea sp. TaxID=69393 RepID=UPI00289DCAAA|nr:helix-turn-helix domain-containing protein [Pantoea sp.]
MTKQIDFIEKVKTLLTNNGVNERKLASTVASILGIHYNSAKQKIDGKRGFSLDEVKLVFKHFNEDFIGQRKHNCVFIMNNIHKRCNVEVEPVKEKNNLNNNESHAIKKDDIYIINTSGNFDQNEFFRVKTIDFLSPPKIAILDNNNDILELLQKITNRYGILSDIFKTVEEIENSRDLLKYDAFILDWLLDFDKTPEKLIKNIRENQESQSLIIILTGELSHNEKVISEMIVDYHIHLIEKPTKPLIISSLLLSKLFFS